ncbi:MAG: alpha-amylase [Bradymonadaceae bacterium]|nr:alpha-amylase [Lujinxingiaceae bacterium]
MCALLFWGCSKPAKQAVIAPDVGSDASLADGASDLGDADEQSDVKPDAETDVPNPPLVPGPERALIYQLIVRHFGNAKTTNALDATIETNGSGKFADIDASALSTLRAMGMTHIYLTGVLQQATATDYAEIGEPADDPDILKGRAGSFFAIRDYFDVSPDYAVDPTKRREEFRALIERIHAHDMKVLIDLVPNHVARSYASTVRPELDLGLGDDQSLEFSPQNNFFYLAGGQALVLPTAESHWRLDGMDGHFAPEDGTPARTVRVTGNNAKTYTPSTNDWYETVKLNWGYDFETGQGVYDPLPPTWSFMDEVVAYWQEFGVDGFRCDFAHYVPDEAWSWLIEQARARDPQAYFVAEAYENLAGLLAAGFDAVYDDELYDGLKGIYNGTHDTFELDAYFASISDASRGQYLRYLENHDERRIASPLVSGVYPGDSGFGSTGAGRHVAPIAYLLGPGPIMIYNGQSVGETGAGASGFSGDDGRSTIFDYWSPLALANWRNQGAFDGALLTEEQRALHAYYRNLLTLAQHPLARSRGYYGLDYFNRDFDEYPGALYAFARFEPGAGRLMVVVTNWSLGTEAGRIRIPEALAGEFAGLKKVVRIRQIFDEQGSLEPVELGVTTRDTLSDEGFAVELPNQASRVYVLE